MQDWERVRRDRERQKQDAIAKEQAVQQQAEQQRLAQERAAQLRAEQIKRNETKIGEDTCDQLMREMNNSPIPQVAERLRQEWDSALPNLYKPASSVTLTAIREPNVHIWGDEARNESRVGMKLSYSYKDRDGYNIYDDDGELTGHVTEVEQKVKVLIIGMGYFLDGNLLVKTSERLPYGTTVKSYFLQANTASRVNDKYITGGLGVPVNYPGALQKFYEFIADLIDELAPKNIVPEASYRAKAYERSNSFLGKLFGW